MVIYPAQVLQLAAKYIGYKEKASDKNLYSFTANAGSGNHTFFQYELDNAKFWNTDKCGYEWCTSFVAWIFWRLLGNTEAKRVLCITGPYGASCVAWAGYYKAQGRLFSIPKVGDQYFQKDMSDGKPCHTGVVESVNGSSFTTIEGNAGNMVKRVTRYLNNTVYGFGRPHYTTDVEPAKPTKPEQEEDEMMRYKTLEEIPAGYQQETKELMELGFNGKGGEKGLDVTEDMLRCMIVLLRATKAMIAAIPGADKQALFDEFKKQLNLTIKIE